MAAKTPFRAVALTEREHATVLAALRYWQANTFPNIGDADLDEIASGGGSYLRLTQREIDRLCERINS